MVVMISLMSETIFPLQCHPLQTVGETVFSGDQAKALHLKLMLCIHFKLLLSTASWRRTEIVCVFCMCAHLSVCWPSTCACWFICHMPRALWNRGTIIHSSGLQHECQPLSLIYSLIYTSDTGSPPSRSPC